MVQSAGYPVSGYPAKSLSGTSLKFNYIGTPIGSIFIKPIPIWEKLTDADTDVSVATSLVKICRLKENTIPFFDDIVK